MLLLDDIKVRFECQGYKATQFSVSHENYKSVLFLRVQLKQRFIVSAMQQRCIHTR